MKGCLEKSLKTKFVFESTSKWPIDCEKYLNFRIFLFSKHFEAPYLSMVINMHHSQMQQMSKDLSHESAQIMKACG